MFQDSLKLILNSNISVPDPLCKFFILTYALELYISISKYIGIEVFNSKMRIFKAMEIKNKSKEIWKHNSGSFALNSYKTPLQSNLHIETSYWFKNSSTHCVQISFFHIKMDQPKYWSNRVEWDTLSIKIFSQIIGYIKSSAFCLREMIFNSLKRVLLFFTVYTFK